MMTTTVYSTSSVNHNSPHTRRRFQFLNATFHSADTTQHYDQDHKIDLQPASNEKHDDEGRSVLGGLMQIYDETFFAIFSTTRCNF